MRYAYFIFILSLFGCLHTNAQANKDYKQVKADKIKKIIVYHVRDTDTIGRTVREYDKKGRIVKYANYRNWGEEFPFVQKEYATNCNVDCIINEEERYLLKDGDSGYHYSLIKISEYRYIGIGNKRELSAYSSFKLNISTNEKKSNSTKEDMYGYLCYLYPKFKEEVYVDSPNLFAQYKSTQNYGFIVLNNRAILGNRCIYLEPLQGDSIPVQINIITQNDSLEAALVCYLYTTGKRKFTTCMYQFIFNKIPLNELSYNFMDSGFYSSLNKLSNVTQKTNCLSDSSRIITYPQGKFKLVTKYFMTPEFDKYPEEDNFYDSTVIKYKRNHRSYTKKVFNNGKQIDMYINNLNIKPEDYYVWDTYLELKRSHSKEYKLEYW